MPHDEFRTVGFPSTSKSSVCWDPLQTLAVQGEQSESFLDYNADSLRATAGAERSHSFPNPDNTKYSANSLIGISY